jgi:hypothetical protein
MNIRVPWKSSTVKSLEYELRNRKEYQVTTHRSLLSILEWTVKGERAKGGGGKEGCRGSEKRQTKRK